MFDLEFTGERLVPGKGDPELQLEHVSRYQFAAGWARHGQVLDFGCGAGYGSAILARAGAQRVVGSDISPAAIHYARQHFGGKNCCFAVANCEATAFADNSFDLVVSFEVIEHLGAYRAFLQEARRILRPGGRFIVSTPNKRTYRAAPGAEPNPFHVHEFDLPELRDELEGLFPSVRVLGQSRTEGVLIRSARDTETPTARLRSRDRERFDESTDYFIALCGDDAESLANDSFFFVSETNALKIRTDRVLELQGELEERTRWAKGLEDESSRRGKRVLELQEELEERTRWAKSLRDESENRARRILELQAELEERMRWATQLEREREKSHQRVVELQREFEIVGQSVERLAGLEGKLEERLQALESGAEQAAEEARRQPLAESENLAEITSLAERLANLESQIDESGQEHQKALRWHHESLLRQRQEIESQRDELSRGVRQARDAMQRTSRHEIELHALTKRARESAEKAEQAQQLINMLWGSRSWKIFSGVSRLLSGRQKDRAETPPPNPDTGAGQPIHRPGTENPPAVEPPLPPAIATSEEPAVSIFLAPTSGHSSRAAIYGTLATLASDLSLEVLTSPPAAGEAGSPAGVRHLAAEADLSLVAQEAKGKVLLWWTGGVELEPADLQILVDTLERRPEAALVGGKVLDSQGRVESAGSILWSDGLSTAYGLGHPPDAPELAFPREVDFLAPGALALRTQSLRRLADVPEIICPVAAAADLALRLRRDGWSCRYQPQVTVQRSSGEALRPSVEGAEALRSLWRSELAQYPAPPSAEAADSQAADSQTAHPQVLDRYREHGRPRRALIVDHRVPTPDQDAGSVRMTALVDSLKEQGFQVTFLPENLYELAPYGERVRRQGAELIVTPQYTSIAGYLAERGDAFDLALVSRFHIARHCMEAVRDLCPRARLVFDTVDLQFLRLERRAELENDAQLAEQARTMRQEEIAVARQADATLLVSEAEREILAREAPDLKLHTVSLIHSLSPDVPPFEGRKDFFFVGGFEHPPNADAVRWFVDQVFPKVLRELPEARLLLIGSKAPPEILELAGDHIEVTGYVEDLAPFLEACRLSIAPLRYGAGIKGKVTQSLSYGLPAVMTTVAAEGIGLRHGVDAMIADDPDAFAEAVVAVYRDEDRWRRLSAAGRKRIEKDFSPAAAGRNVRALCADLGLEEQDPAEGAADGERRSRAR